MYGATTTKLLPTTSKNMDATRQDMGLLGNIRPPRLEDAGLEDCALPPESIKEAFLKAAAAVGSRAASILTPADADDCGCLDDPFPTGSGSSDVLVGTAPEEEPPGSCAGEKGDRLSGVVDDGARDLVGRRNDEEEGFGKSDEVFVAGPEAEEGGDGDCVDSLRGLKIVEEEEAVESGGEEGDSERPALVEGGVVLMQKSKEPNN